MGVWSCLSRSKQSWTRQWHQQTSWTDLYRKDYMRHKVTFHKCWLLYHMQRPIYTKNAWILQWKRLQVSHARSHSTRKLRTWIKNVRFWHSALQNSYVHHPMSSLGCIHLLRRRVNDIMSVHTNHPSTLFADDLAKVAFLNFKGPVYMRTLFCKSCSEILGNNMILITLRIMSNKLTHTLDIMPFSLKRRKSITCLAVFQLSDVNPRSVILTWCRINM